MILEYISRFVAFIASLLKAIPTPIWQYTGYSILALIGIKLGTIGFKHYIKPYMSPYIKWGNQTALILGWPMLIILIFTCTSKLAFSASCLSVGSHCQYAMGVSEMAQSYLTSLVGGDADINVVPRDKKLPR